jgi:hypothetical protein
VAQNSSISIPVILQDSPANRTATGALGALDDAVTVSGEGSGILAWEVDTGTLSGTVVFEATYDDANWFAVNAVQLATGTVVASITSFPDRGYLAQSGFSQARLRVSVYSSGTSNARMEVSAGTFPAAELTGIPATDVRAAAHGIGPTQVAAGADTTWKANRHGIPFVIGGHPNIIRYQERFTADPAGGILGAGTAIVMVVTQVHIWPERSVSNEVIVTVGMSATTTLPTDANDCVFNGQLTGGDQINIGNGAGMIVVGDAGMDLRADFNGTAPTGGAICIGHSYYTVES